VFLLIPFHFTCHPLLPREKADVEEDIDSHHSKYSDVGFVADGTDTGISSLVAPSTFSSSHDYQTEL
jgi:hypothetical protein